MKYLNLIKSNQIIPMHRKLPICVRSTRDMGNVGPSANTTIKQQKRKRERKRTS